ncbi:hypothetical protein M8J77_015974 [Diaphorina citri]|nr:hypothetical protein M8J77_015974 [Diaphorina citri]
MNNKSAAIVSAIAFLLEEERLEEDMIMREEETEDQEVECLLEVGISQTPFNSIASQIIVESHSRPMGYYEVWIDRYTEEDFRRLFRMRPQSFENLLKVITEENPDFETAWISGKEPVTPRKKALIGLKYMGFKQTIRELGDQFNLSDSATLHAIDSFCLSLVKMKDKIIRWPTETEAKEIVEQFRVASNFPGILGAIDGTYIEAKFAKDIGQYYINRKYSKTINVQAICTSKKIFTQITVGSPGSVHDAHVLFDSGITHRIDRDGPLSITYKPEYHIIGDSAYPLRTWWMVPYKGTVGPAEKNYNTALSKSRVVIENTFGLLKGRWKRLQYIDVSTVERVCTRITTAFVLHNYCLLEGDILEETHEETPIHHNVPPTLSKPTFTLLSLGEQIH